MSRSSLPTHGCRGGHSASRTLAALLLATAIHAPALALAQPADRSPGTDPPVSQVLIIPLAGTLPAPFTRAPDQLTQALERVVSALGAEPVAAAVGKADITAITGCPAESDDCFREIASTIEVDQIVFGSVEPAADGGGIEVTLTLIRRDGDLSRRRIPIDSVDVDSATVAFEPAARAFLLGENPPSEPPPDLTVPATAVTASSSPRFEFGRVKPYSWAITGGGIALVGVGAILLSKASAKQDEVDQARVDTVADFERLADLEKSGKRLTSWGNVCLIGGSLAAVAGIALVVKQGLARDNAAVPTAAAPTTEFALTPLAGDVGVAITVLGRF